MFYTMLFTTTYLLANGSSLFLCCVTVKSNTVFQSHIGSRLTKINSYISNLPSNLLSCTNNTHVHNYRTTVHVQPGVKSTVPQEPTNMGINK